MNEIQVRFAGTVPGWMATLLVAAAVALVVWTYRRTRDRTARGYGALLPALRILLVLLLIGCLVEPVLSFRSSPDTPVPVLMLVDTSKSMSIPDGGGGRTRLDAALAPCKPPEDLARRIEDRFPVRYFAFDAGARALAGRNELAALEPEGEMTLVGEALASAVAQAGSGEPAGIVLLSDGADQSSSDTVGQARALGAPVYAIAVGDVAASYQGQPDVAIADVAGERFMSVNAENALTVRVEQRGYDTASTLVEARDMASPDAASAGGIVLASETVSLDSPSAQVVLRVPPKTVGKHVFEIAVQPLEGEALVENNRRRFSAIVEKKHIAVLFIEGTPRWEYKFLKRALERDPVVQFTGFVQGQDGLFLRQGEAPENGVLPASVDDLEPFDVIFLGDVAPTGLPGGLSNAMRDAILERGKGLALLPGFRCADGGGFGATPLAEVLPALPAAAQGDAFAGAFVPNLTPAGRDHPIFANLADEFDKSGGAPELPGCLPLAHTAPGASVLAVNPNVRSNGESPPICVVQTAGKGRALVMGTDGTWRWRMGASLEADADARTVHARFWGQAVRWLAGRQDKAGDDQPFIAYASRDRYEPGESQTLYARVPGPPAPETGTAPSPAVFPEAQVSASIRGPTGEVFNTPLEFVPGSAGLHKVSLSFSASGEYVAEVIAKRANLPDARDTATFFVGHPYGEFDRIAMNERLLRSLAFETGGAFYTPDEAVAIAGDLVAAEARRGEFVEKHLARLPSAYALMVALAALEWFLRKRRGLM